jgi:nucleoside-diphosphate kinase
MLSGTPSVANTHGERTIVERTLILLKPDAVQRALVGRIIERFELKGIKIVGIKMMRVSEELAHRHYQEHVGRPYFEPLVRFITSSPIVAVALEGTNVIARVRKLVGATQPDNSEPGTIRGDFSNHAPMNLVHASDAPESAARELALFFAPDELFDYARSDALWIGL